VHKASSFSEAVYNFALEAKFHIKKNVAQELMVGVIDYSNILEGCESDLPFEIMSQLKNLGANTYKALRKIYFAKSESNYFVQQVLMRNIKVDNANKIVWSAVEYGDIVKAGVGFDELDVKGRIVFNLSECYDLYIAAYEYEQQTLKVVIQSNNPEKYSALKIAMVFGGKGNDVCASCTIKNAAASDFKPVVYAVLKDQYNVSTDQTEVSEDGSDNNPY
jgi:nanoRNase/pAp phosphatase (c-di-AMP/oligoRNAs hydrolase)